MNAFLWTWAQLRRFSVRMTAPMFIKNIAQQFPYGSFSGLDVKVMLGSWNEFRSVPSLCEECGISRPGSHLALVIFLLEGFGLMTPCPPSLLFCARFLCLCSSVSACCVFVGTDPFLLVSQHLSCKCSLQYWRLLRFTEASILLSSLSLATLFTWVFCLFLSV